MVSTTKTKLDESQIKSIFRQIFKTDNIKNIIELKDGCFNATYLVELDKRKEFVLKVAPPVNVSILSYEQNMMETEIHFHKLSKDKTNIPIPGIIYSDLSRTIIPYDFFIMEKLHGTPLDKFPQITFEQRKAIFIQLAESLAQMHKIKGEHFGYLLMEKEIRGKSYFEAFSHMIYILLKDGRSRKVNLPIAEKEILAILKRYKDAFDSVSEPSFVHYDLWDGNIFVVNLDSEPVIEGLIDFERSFYADPAADFSQISGYKDLGKNSWFLEEYNKYAEKPFVLDENAKIRIKLFRLYLFLIMVIESYFRDIDGSYNDQLKWSEGELVKIVSELKVL